ncbi:MAG: indole-3-glycerol phosphate synthase TrpC [bacterium]|nr:indole-3-glycerol phosphate synthase TrpC [bacterium]
MFVKTDTILDKILAQKVDEVATRQAKMPLKKVQNLARVACVPRHFDQALRVGEYVTLIAEVKKASPSKGVLIENFDPATIGKTYADNGASAISVLTDTPFFMGDLAYLNAVRGTVRVPVLRKDFIIDPYQVYETRAEETDALLLIVAALDDAQLADLHALTTEMGMSALVEVHDEAEVERALKVGATIIGVNNRDLKSFDVDLNTTERLAKLLPKEVILVAESGISSPADVMRMGQVGAHAVLVGESLVKSGDMAEAVKQFSTVSRP